MVMEWLGQENGLMPWVVVALLEQQKDMFYETSQQFFCLPDYAGASLFLSPFPNKVVPLKHEKQKLLIYLQNIFLIR